MSMYLPWVGGWVALACNQLQKHTVVSPHLKTLQRDAMPCHNLDLHTHKTHICREKDFVLATQIGSLQLSYVDKHPHMHPTCTSITQEHPKETCGVLGKVHENWHTYNGMDITTQRKTPQPLTYIGMSTRRETPSPMGMRATQICTPASKSAHAGISVCCGSIKTTYSHSHTYNTQCPQRSSTLYSNPEPSNTLHGKRSQVVPGVSHKHPIGAVCACMWTTSKSVMASPLALWNSLQAQSDRRPVEITRPIEAVSAHVENIKSVMISPLNL